MYGRSCLCTIPTVSLCLKEIFLARSNRICRLNNLTLSLSCAYAKGPINFNCACTVETMCAPAVRCASIRMWLCRCLRMGNLCRQMNSCVRSPVYIRLCACVIPRTHTLPLFFRCELACIYFQTKCWVALQHCLVIAHGQMLWERHCILVAIVFLHDNFHFINLRCTIHILKIVLYIIKPGKEMRVCEESASKKKLARI